MRTTKRAISIRAVKATLTSPVPPAIRDRWARKLPAGALVGCGRMRSIHQPTSMEV